LHRNHQQPAQSDLFDVPAAGPAGEPEHRTAATPHEAAIEKLLTRCPSLADLQAAAAGCTACALRSGCAQVVFGEGNPTAGVIFIGEGPGETEDQLGRPFVGRAGQLLDKILEASGFPREDVYIANVVKCRPPDNRQPTPQETQACLPWLEAQIRLIRPRFLVLLGASAAQTMLDPKLRITAARGRWRERQGLRCLPTFHPAALLRDPSKKRPVWEDMKKLRAEYDKTTARER